MTMRKNVKKQQKYCSIKLFLLKNYYETAKKNNWKKEQLNNLSKKVGKLLITVL